MSAPQSLVRELCVSIAGQWEPDRLFMIFTVYIDESDTHGPEPDMTMGAMLGSAAQWERFGRRLRGLKRRYGFTTFHATEFKGQTGEFRGWSYEKCQGLLGDFGKIVSGNLTETVTVSLRYQDYRKHFLDVRPPKMHATSQYGFCFLAVLDMCSVQVLERGENHRLSVVVESGHPNAADTARLFAERQKEDAKQNFDFLRTHTLARKKDIDLLEMADLVAFGTAQENRAIREGVAPPHGKRGRRAPAPRETGWTNVKIDSDFLTVMIQEFNEGRATRREDWLKRKAAWREAQGRPS